MNGVRGDRARGLPPAAGRVAGPVTGRVCRGALTGRPGLVRPGAPGRAGGAVVLGGAVVVGVAAVVGVARPGAVRRPAAGRGVPGVRGIVSVAMSMSPRVMLLS